MTNSSTGPSHAGATFTAAFAAVMVLVSTAMLAPVAQGQPVHAEFLDCPGWGACRFLLADGSQPLVRIRGLGDPAHSGICAAEGRAEGVTARHLRGYIQGILARASRVELQQPEPRAGGLLATVVVDGTELMQIASHFGMGRIYPKDARADWCD
jgi:hypothetical protein